MKRIARNPYPRIDLSLFCRLWKKHKDLTGSPLCVAYQEKTWKNRYRTIQAAIACGDLDWVLGKMIEEKWSTKDRMLVLVAWYDYHFANDQAQLHNGVKEECQYQTVQYGAV